MSEQIDVYGIDWNALSKRRQELKNLSDMADTSNAEEEELTEINKQFALLHENYQKTEETTAREYHPGQYFFGAISDTNKEITEKLHEASEQGQPISPPQEQEGLIVVKSLKL